MCRRVLQRQTGLHRLMACNGACSSIHHKGCLLALEHDLATLILFPITIVLVNLHIPVVCMRQESDMSTRTAVLCLHPAVYKASAPHIMTCQIITGMPYTITSWYGCV